MREFIELLSDCGSVSAGGKRYDLIDDAVYMDCGKSYIYVGCIDGQIDIDFSTIQTITK